MTAVREPKMRVELPKYELTLDDVAELAAADEYGHRYELVDGNLLVMAPADVDHMQIITELVVWFVTHGHSKKTVLPTPGLRIDGRSSGRNPDLLLLRRPVPGDVIWVEPEDTLLAVEVVSPGSRSEDRLRKPVEYARAGVPHFWRIEREGGAATAHMYTLGVDERGDPAYLGHRAVLLDELLAGEPPKL